MGGDPMKLLLQTLSVVACLTGSTAMAQVVSDETATIKITQWIGDDIIAATDAAMERFAVTHPNVTIEPNYVPVGGGEWGAYTNAFLNEVASGNAPDIIGSAIEGFAEMAASGVLLDLETIVATDEAAQAVMAGIETNLLDGMRTKGTGDLNFFPTQWNNIVMFYNKDMFDAAGIDYPSDDWTWEDFLAAAQATTVKDANGNTTQFGYFVPGFNFGMQPWFMTNSASVLDADWIEPTVDTAEYRETLQFMHDLINVHGVAPAFEPGVGTEKFTAGQVAMYSAGHWPVPAIREALENVGVAHMPMNTVQTTVFGIGGLAITKDSPNIDLAWAFVTELAGEQYQQDLADVGASIPSMRKYALDADYISWPDNSEIFYQTAATALPVPAPSNFAQVQEITDRYFATFVNGEVSLEDTISGMDRELRRAMARAQ